MGWLALAVLIVLVGGVEIIGIVVLVGGVEVMGGARAIVFLLREVA